MDIIFLRELKVETVIGVYDWERQVPQTIHVDLDIGLPSSAACLSDDVEDTIDYGRVVERIRQTLAEQHYALVEAVAEHIAQLLINEFATPWVRVAVAKLGLIRGVRLLGVTIERSAPA